MIKLYKKVKLLRKFKLQITNTIVMPNLIKDKDIYAMFCGLMSVIKSQVKTEAQKEKEHDDYSYSFLLKMYLKAVKEMNKYKALCLRHQVSIKEA